MGAAGVRFRFVPPVQACNHAHAKPWAWHPAASIGLLYFVRGSLHYRFASNRCWRWQPDALRWQVVPRVAGPATGLNLGAASGEAVKLTGSGASFPFPIYGRWFKQYSESHPGVKVDYQAKGSGAGIKDFMNQTVDFAASDAAMTDDENAQVERGVQLLPLTAGEIVLAYNIPDGPAARNHRGRRTLTSFSAKSPTGMTQPLPRRIRTKSCRI